MSHALGSNQCATIKNLLAGAPRALQLDAQLLLAHVLRCSRAHILAHPERILNAHDAQDAQTLIARREAQEPLAYILGNREFFGLQLEVTPSVLIPRPDTELLVEQCLARAQQGARVLDLGTGSGAIAIALKHNRADLQVTALDNDTAALVVARRNAQRHGCEIHWVQSNWFSELKRTSSNTATTPRFDLIVSNPPYIARQDPHLEQLIHEPQQALVAGIDGLDAYRVIAAEAEQFLAPEGLLLLEQGAQQAAAVVELLGAHDFQNITTHRDLAGHQRVSVARKRSSEASA